MSMGTRESGLPYAEEIGVAPAVLSITGLRFPIASALG